MIEHRTTEMAVSDLDKYWTALDKVCLSLSLCVLGGGGSVLRILGVRFFGRTTLVNYIKIRMGIVVRPYSVKRDMKTETPLNRVLSGAAPIPHHEDRGH